MISPKSNMRVGIWKYTPGKPQIYTDFNTRISRIKSVKSVFYFFLPIAKRLAFERTYITPSDKAGVAISSSPIELVAMWLNFSPAETTSISPSSFDK